MSRSKTKGLEKAAGHVGSGKTLDSQAWEGAGLHCANTGQGFLANLKFPRGPACRGLGIPLSPALFVFTRKGL